MKVHFSNSHKALLSPGTAFFTLTISPLDSARSVLEHCIASVEMISQQLKTQACHEVVANMQYSPNDDLEPFDNITVNLSSVPKLSSVQLVEVVNLFHEYHHIFWTRPGRNLLYPCQFNVTEKTMFKISPYPVPFDVVQWLKQNWTVCCTGE